MSAAKISDAMHSDVERLLNKAIHELVFAVHHSDDDQPGEACTCLITAQQNIESVATMLAAIDPDSAMKADSKAKSQQTDDDNPVETLIRVAAEAFQLLPRQLCGSDRTSRPVLARQTAMFLIRSRLGLTQREIGRRFSREHGTVIHALKTVEDRRSTDRNFAAKLARIEALLGPRNQ